MARILAGALLLVGLIAYVATRVFRSPAAPAPDTPAAVSSAPDTTTLPGPAPVIGPEPPLPVLNEASGPPSPAAPLPAAALHEATPVAAASSLEDIVGAAVPAVVSIETGNGRGSGFFIDPGIIVTNNHVVAGHVSVTVRLPAGSSVPGRVERRSADLDLAIVRVDGLPATQPVLQFGSAADVRIGQEVIAIGLAMGHFQGTVTRGIISAFRRAGPGSGVLLLQTDAAINPGSSGGPLIDRMGKVIGITTLKVSGSAESLGFAVASDHAQSLLAGGPSRVPDIATSVPRSAPLAPAFSAKSDAEVLRDRGLQRFDESLRALAARALQVDAYWVQIKRECGGRASGTYHREWFAIWDDRLSIMSADPGCLSALNAVRRAADELRDVMATLHEEARRAGVYPGDLRQARNKHQLDWPGWDR